MKTNKTYVWSYTKHNQSSTKKFIYLFFPQFGRDVRTPRNPFSHPLEVRAPPIENRWFKINKKDKQRQAVMDFMPSLLCKSIRVTDDHNAGAA